MPFIISVHFPITIAIIRIIICLVILLFSALKMSFGFSVGDFLAAATLIKDIVTCLRDSGGAASEYQELMLELDGLHRALDKIEHLRASPGRAESINGLKVAALNCAFVLQDFYEKLDTYKRLGQEEKQRSARRSGKMIRWELTMKEDVRNLRTYLQVHTSTLIARLAIEALSVEPFFPY